MRFVTNWKPGTVWIVALGARTGTGSVIGGIIFGNDGSEIAIRTAVNVCTVLVVGLVWVAISLRKSWREFKACRHPLDPQCAVPDKPPVRV